MSWQQFHFALREAELEAVEAALEQLGALAVTLRDAEDQPIFEPLPGTVPLWTQIRVTALFSASVSPTEVYTALSGAFPDAISAWNVETLADQDWERAWMDDFKPMRFGQRLWIVPSCHTPPDPHAVNLMLDPGLAFGTGTHATTALCLEWLEQRLEPDSTVLDYGCGSGVLGIAALKLGARWVHGVDLDPQALIATQDNLQRNTLNPESMPCFLPDALPQGLHYDVVVANILAGPLQELASLLCEKVRPGGALVISGILAEQREAVLQSYAGRVDIQALRQQDDWLCIWGQRPLDPQSN